MSAATMIASDGLLTLGSDSRMTPDAAPTNGAPLPEGEDAPFAGELKRVLEGDDPRPRGDRARVLPDHAAARAARSPVLAAMNRTEAEAMVERGTEGTRQGSTQGLEPPMATEDLDDTIDDVGRGGVFKHLDVSLPGDARRQTGPLQARPARPGDIESPERPSIALESSLDLRRGGLSAPTERPAPSAATMPAPPPSPSLAPLEGNGDSTYPDGLPVPGMAIQDEHTLPSATFPSAPLRRTRGGVEASPLESEAAEDDAEEPSADLDPSALQRLAPYFAGAAVMIDVPPPPADTASADATRGRAPLRDTAPRTGLSHDRALDWPSGARGADPSFVRGAPAPEDLSSRIAAALPREVGDGTGTLDTEAPLGPWARRHVHDPDGGRPIGAWRPPHESSISLADPSTRARSALPATGAPPLPGAPSAAGASADVRAASRAGVRAAPRANTPSLDGASADVRAGASADVRAGASADVRAASRSAGLSGSGAPFGAGADMGTGAGAADAPDAGPRRDDGAAARADLRSRGSSGAARPLDGQGRSHGAQGAAEARSFEPPLRTPADSIGARQALSDARAPTEPQPRALPDTHAHTNTDVSDRPVLDARARAQGARAAAPLPDAARSLDDRVRLSGEVAMKRPADARTMTQRSFTGAPAPSPARRPPASVEASNEPSLNTDTPRTAERLSPETSPRADASRAAGQPALRANPAWNDGARGPNAPNGGAAARETGTFAIPRGAAPSAPEAPRSPRGAEIREAGPSRLREAADARAPFDAPPQPPREGASAGLPTSAARTVPRPDASRSRTFGAAEPPRGQAPSTSPQDRTPSQDATRASASASTTGAFRARGGAAAARTTGRDALPLDSAQTASKFAAPTRETPARDSALPMWAPARAGDEADASTTGTFAAARARDAQTAARRTSVFEGPPLYPTADDDRESPAAAFQAARAVLANAELRPRAAAESLASARAVRRATATDPLAAARLARATRESPFAGRDAAPATAPFAGRDGSPFAASLRDNGGPAPATHISAASNWGPDTIRDPFAAERAESTTSNTASPERAPDTIVSAKDDAPTPHLGTASPALANAPIPHVAHGATNANSILAMSPPPGAASQTSATTAHLEERLGERRQRIVAGIRGGALPREARAEADIPDLGRIAVEARPHGAEVDVRVTAQKAEAARVLHEAAPSLETHLRQNQVPLGNLSVGDRGAGDSPRGDHRQSPTPQDPNDAPPQGKPASPFLARSRVRVVM